MSNTSNLDHRELTDIELDAVSGGMLYLNGGSSWLDNCTAATMSMCVEVIKAIESNRPKPIP